jgi:hypothetical protein
MKRNLASKTMNETRPASGNTVFRTTRWTMVIRAQGRVTGGARRPRRSLRGLLDTDAVAWYGTRNVPGY